MRPSSDSNHFGSNGQVPSNVQSIAAIDPPRYRATLGGCRLLGVLLTIAVIVVSGSAGVAAERRWPASAVGWARGALVLSLYTLIPFVVFFSLVRVELDTDAGGGLVIGWIAILAATGLAWLAGSWLLRLNRPATGTLITGTLVPNSGYLGYPLVVSLLGFDALGEAVVYNTVVPAPSLLLLGFATGAAFGTKAGETVRQRIVAFFTRNPPLYAAIAALLAPDSLAPDLLVSLPFIDLPGPYLLIAAMPCGINTLLVAHVYGLDAKLAAQAVTWTTAIAVAAALIAQAIWG